MKRDELYRLAKPLHRGPKEFHVYIIVSRNDRLMIFSDRQIFRAALFHRHRAKPESGGC